MTKIKLSIKDAAASAEEVTSHLDSNGVDLFCEGFSVRVTAEAYAEACAVIAESNPNDLSAMLKSIERTISNAIPKFDEAMSKFSIKKRKIFMDNLVDDLKLRAAIKQRMEN